MVDGIALQTNILALNAAMEAPRAGGQSCGLAWVAGEVRNLAQRSPDAAKAIKVLTDDSVARLATGSQQVDQAGATMGGVMSPIQRLSEIVRDFFSASTAQRQDVSAISGTLNQMDQNVQQNAALVEASAAAESLRQQASALVESMAVFKTPGA